MNTDFEKTLGFCSPKSAIAFGFVLAKVQEMGLENDEILNLSAALYDAVVKSERNFFQPNWDKYACAFHLHGWVPVGATIGSTIGKGN